METLNDAAADMLRQFRALLSRTPTPVGSTRLLQLMTINMFAISNSSLKGTAPFLIYFFSLFLCL